MKAFWKKSGIIMNGSALRSILPVAVGAGVVIGAAGVFLYDHFFREKRRMVLQREVANLDICLSELRRELESLNAEICCQVGEIFGIPCGFMNYTYGERYPVRVLQGKANLKKKKKEYQEEDTDEDEFFDISDSENDDEYNSSISLFEFKRQVVGRKYDTIDTLLDGDEQSIKKAFNSLQILLDEDSQNPELLWRSARACHLLAKRMEGRGEDKKSHAMINQGITYAEKCLELAPRSSDAHKWYAICIGARSEHLPVKEKVKDGLTFKKHIEEALRINPSDGTLHHLLGRFKYEIATLTWVERKIATALFGEIPYASFDEALQSLFQAEELCSDPWKENKLLIAKCYLNLNDSGSFATWIRKAKDVRCESPEDKAADAEICKLMAKHKIK